MPTASSDVMLGVGPMCTSNAHALSGKWIARMGPGTATANWVWLYHACMFSRGGKRETDLENLDLLYKILFAI